MNFIKRVSIVLIFIIIAGLIPIKSYAGLLLKAPWSFEIDGLFIRNLGSGSPNTGVFAFYPGYTIQGAERKYVITLDVSFGKTSSTFTFYDAGFWFEVLPVFKAGGLDFNLEVDTFFPGSKDSRANSLRFNIAPLLTTGSTLGHPKIFWESMLMLKMWWYKYSTQQAYTEDITRRTIEDVLAAFRDNALNDLFAAQFRVGIKFKPLSNLIFRVRYYFQPTRTYSDKSVGLSADWYGIMRIENRLIYIPVPWLTLNLMTRHAGKVLENPTVSMFKKSSMTFYAFVEFYL